MAYAASDFARDGSLVPPFDVPDPRFKRPASRLYAQIVLPAGKWESDSAQGPQLPEGGLPDPGTREFEGPLPATRIDGGRGEVYRYGIGLVWAERGPDNEFPYTIFVMEDAQTLAAQVRVFRAALWAYLGGAGLIGLISVLTFKETAGRSLHAQEMDFNDIRTTLQALIAIYDNCNSLHTNAYDEAITTPTEESVRRALAIQLIHTRDWGQATNE